MDHGRGELRRVSKSEPDQIDYLVETSGQRWEISDEYLKRIQGITEDFGEKLILANKYIQDGLPGLTKKQQEILRLYLLGDTQDIIADKLKIHRSTVRTTLIRLSAKLKKLIPELQED